MYSLVGVLGVVILMLLRIVKDGNDVVMYELVGVRLLLKFVLFIYEMV